MQVDREELQRIAITIARNAVPPAVSSDGAEAAARLNISAAVLEKAEEHDSSDPLGYGRIDTRLLTLVGGHARGTGNVGRPAAALCKSDTLTCLLLICLPSPCAVARWRGRSLQAALQCPRECLRGNPSPAPRGRAGGPPRRRGQCRGAGRGAARAAQQGAAGQRAV